MTTQHEKYTHDAALSVAVLSIILYSFVAAVSYHYYHKFVEIEKINEGVSLSVYYRTNIGRYDDAKKLFFRILMISSLMEIPSYIGCLATGCPTDCEWDSLSQIFFWFLHLLALCGYALCIIMPCVLWSDMINKRDGKLFFSSFPYDNIKIFFRLLITLYFINMFVDIICTLIFYRPSDPKYYLTITSYAVCTLTECTLIFLISLGCLYCGIKLQRYVRKAKLNPIIERKFLFSLNIILLLIVLSLLGRAVLIIGLLPFMPDSFSTPVQYPFYIFISRWLPDVICQLCLVLLMRTPSSEIAKKTLPPPPVSLSSPDSSPSMSRKMEEERISASSNHQHFNNEYSGKTSLSSKKRGSEPMLMSQGTGDDRNSQFDFFSIFRLSKNSSKLSSFRRQSETTQLHELKNPLIENSMSSKGDQESSFAVSALDSTDDDSYVSNSYNTSTHERLKSNDIIQEHLNILTHLTHLKADERGQQDHTPNANSSKNNSSGSYSYTKEPAFSVDSSHVAIGDSLYHRMESGSYFVGSPSTNQQNSVDK
jgi:hypothetical protein